MSIVDKKYEEEQIRLERQAEAEEVAAKLSEAFSLFVNTSDGAQSMQYLSSVMDGNALGWGPNERTTLTDRALFALGLQDVYLVMLAHCIPPGEDLHFGGVDHFNLNPSNEQKAAVARAFSTREGQYILSQLRKGYYDTAPASTPDVQRYVGQRWFINHILELLSHAKEEE